MISTVVVSYKRPELLRVTLESYLATVSVPYALVVVDNGSCPEALEVARELGVEVIELGENHFPGYSTNVGWDHLSTNLATDLLHRSDNDVEYLEGWCEEVIRNFEAGPNLGQLGLRTWKRKAGIRTLAVTASFVRTCSRWCAGREDPWQPGVKTEDYYFTTEVQAEGFNWSSGVNSLHRPPWSSVARAAHGSRTTKSHGALREPW